MATEIQRKYQDIRDEYENKWLKKRYRGKLVHSKEYIYVKLGEQFYLSPKTIEDIIFYRYKLVSTN
jgi:hypothetical protein